VNTQPNTTNQYDNVIQFPTPQNYIRPAEPKKKITPEELSVLNDFDTDMKTRHDAEPFKSKEDVEKILNYFLDQHNKSYITAQKYPNSPTRKYNPRYLRNYILFQIGCNAGIRCSDLTQLQLGHLIDKQGYYREVIEIIEKKTVNTRKVLKSKIIDINDCIISAVEIYKKFNPNWTRQDYLFPSDYDKDGNPTAELLTRRGVDHIIRNTTKQLGIQGRYASHSFRKTFGRQFILENGNNERSVLMLQEIYGHSDLKNTKHYIGLTRNEIRTACLNLNAGFRTEELVQRGLL
jgi:site-specific recombinase XerD